MEVMLVIMIGVFVIYALLRLSYKIVQLQRTITDLENNKRALTQRFEQCGVHLKDARKELDEARKEIQAFRKLKPTKLHSNPLSTQLTKKE